MNPSPRVGSKGKPPGVGLPIFSSYLMARYYYQMTKQVLSTGFLTQNHEKNIGPGLLGLTKGFARFLCPLHRNLYLQTPHRSEFDKVLARDESLSPGVYFLTGIDPKTNKSAIYIGEAECVRDRVKSHLSKDFWNNITFFITKDENLTKAHIKYIEGRLIEVARSIERSVVMNNQGSGAKLPESDREDMEVFLEKMQQVLPVLGVEAFVQKASTIEEKEQKNLLSCNIKELKATGYLTPNGIVVLKGSQAVLEERGSAKKWPSVLVQRNKLIEEGVLVSDNGAYIFTKDVDIEGDEDICCFP